MVGLHLSIEQSGSYVQFRVFLLQHVVPCVLDVLSVAVKIFTKAKSSGCLLHITSQIFILLKKVDLLIHTNIFVFEFSSMGWSGVFLPIRLE